jgi:hypothetical protein
VVPLFLDDPFTDRAAAAVRGRDLLVSDWAALEFSNVVARHVRVDAIAADIAARITVDFDAWRSAVSQPLDTMGADVAVATQFVRQLAFGIRAADAVHLAIALRSRAQLVTFDKRMSEAASAVGVTVADG